MRVIFLDVDGVLNSAVYYARCNYRPPWPHLDPDAITLLNTLVARSGAAVVVSSSWRTYGLPRLRGFLRAAGYTGRLLGRTPLLPGRPRGEEIQAWLDRCRRPVERFVILDDDDDMVHLRSRLIWTDPRVGLTAEDVAAALAAIGPDDDCQVRSVRRLAPGRVGHSSQLRVAW